ncbi:hypothetical protein [Campylobacter rectus]|uniref:hypothetical protein n=1 Tax=Campylobacter rectus TaxID=203 RepID=UPI0023F392B7|nr:hypothetical protein [Campylobacter rectus]
MSYARIERGGFYDDADGRSPQDRLQQGWSDDEREGGTDIVSRTIRKIATRSWGICFTARIASLMSRSSSGFACSQAAVRRAWYARCSRTMRARTSFAWARSATACVLARSGLDFCG